MVTMEVIQTSDVSGASKLNCSALPNLALEISPLT